MSVITEIREFTIPPCKIDKELIARLGKVLEDVVHANVHYTFDSRTRKIESDKYIPFTAADWSNDVKEIKIEVGASVPKSIFININFSSMSESKVTIASSDATWADGVSRQIENVFNAKKLGYHLIVERRSVKFIITIITWLSMSLALTYPIVEAYSLIGAPVYFDRTFVLISIFGGLLGGIFILNNFLNWLFPRFEFGEPLQKRIRKWIWGLMVSSGFLATLAFRLLGL